MQRRSFLKNLACASLLLPAMSGLPRMRAFAQTLHGSPFLRREAEGADGVMVIIRLFGGNDGLNTLVPYQDDRYYRARGRGTDLDLSIAPERVLRLHDTGTLGFHPAFAPMHELYMEGKMAIVQNVGYPDQDLSHFRSTDIWLSGSDADVYETSGWYARYLESRHPNYPDVLPDAPFAIEVDTYLGTSLMGRRGDMGIAVSDFSFIPDHPAQIDGDHATNAAIEERFVRETMRQSSIFLDAVAGAHRRAARNTVAYPGDSLLGGQLAAVARMIAGGLPTQLYVINVDGFDTHFDQQARHANLLGYIAGSMHAFQRDIEGLGVAHRVSMMTISEFGRRVASNGSGTDHGAAAPLFVIGQGVRGGIIGADPDLGDLDEAGNLRMQFDFRQIYASVLGQWLGATGAELEGDALPRGFEQLPIFQHRSTTFTEAARSSPELRLTLSQNHPNPARTITTIEVGGIPPGGQGTLTLHDIGGRQVLRRAVGAEERSIALDVRDLPAGSYLYMLQAGAAQCSGRMVVRH